MDDTFAILRATRENVLKFTAGLSNEELVCIPDGQGNHILWQMGHIWVTLELLASQYTTIFEEAPCNPLMCMG